LRETVDRLRQSQEENEMTSRRKDELESRVAALEAEYEELLGSFSPAPRDKYLTAVDLLIEKTIHDEETSNVDIAESMTELKACVLHDVVLLSSYIYLL
jgi:kinesin family protein 5